MSDDNKWSQPDSPPPPLFTGKKEKDLVKQVNDEIIERVVGQTVLYYPISLEHTDFHDPVSYTHLTLPTNREV